MDWTSAASGSRQSALSTRWRSSRTSTKGIRRCLSASCKARHDHARHAGPWRGERREDLLADRLDVVQEGCDRAEQEHGVVVALVERQPGRRHGCPARSSRRGSSSSRSPPAPRAGASAYRRHRPAARSAGHGEPAQDVRGAPRRAGRQGLQWECWLGAHYRRPGLVNILGRRRSGRGAGSIVAQKGELRVSEMETSPQTYASVGTGAQASALRLSARTPPG